MVKTKKIMVLASAVVLSFTCCVTVIGISAKSEAKNKTITIKKGDSYKIKMKKGSKVTSSNIKIAKVNDKGKVTALKKGRCKITVKKGKIIRKYNVIVKNKSEDGKVNKNDNVTNTPGPTQTAQPTPAVGGVMYVGGLIVDKIVAKDAMTSYVYFARNPKAKYSGVDVNSEVKYIMIEVSNTNIMNRETKVGDYVGFTHLFKCETEIIGENKVYKGLDSCCIMPENSAYDGGEKGPLPPTQSPTAN